MTDRTDYLVKGCGAVAMAFVDTMLSETDATFTIVDRRDAPGGHWNDAYPFVRLHQPSAIYGVPSRKLGNGRKDATGFNKGLHELASGIEVADYFHQLMRDKFLASGRVSYLPVSEVISAERRDEAEIAALVSGKRRRIGINRKFVDATMLNTAIPLTHSRNFTLAESVACIPPNDLTRRAPEHAHFTVLGAGKTAVDSVLWLLANGADPDTISWVMPRDLWMFNRANFQPGAEYLEGALSALARQYEIWAEAISLRDLSDKMASENLWLRLDPEVEPEMLHGATVTIAELEALRTVKNIIRKGRVRRIEANAVILDQGEVPSRPDTLYVDCTARALVGNVNDTRPVFSPGLLRLQMIRMFQPTFSAALIGFIEATISDESQQNELSRVTPMTDTVADWAATQATSMANQNQWMTNERVASWIARTRLDLLTGQVMQIRKDDTAKRALLGRMAASGLAAATNLHRLSQDARPH